MRFYYALKSKTEVRDAFKKLTSMLETQYGIKLINLATDGEKALLTKELVKFIEGLGIRVFQSAPSTPTQNGHAERSGAVVKERARLMNLDSRIPEELWTETYRTAVYLLNRTPLKGSDHSWRSPHERWWTYMRTTTLYTATSSESSRA
ncbi:integrase core domain-containing protein [Hirsutella rhossiliensis]